MTSSHDKVLWSILRGDRIIGETPHPMKRSQAAVYAVRIYGMGVTIQQVQS